MTGSTSLGRSRAGLCGLVGGREAPRRIWRPVASSIWPANLRGLPLFTPGQASAQWRRRAALRVEAAGGFGGTGGGWGSGSNPKSGVPEPPTSTAAALGGLAPSSPDPAQLAGNSGSGEAPTAAATKAAAASEVGLASTATDGQQEQQQEPSSGTSSSSSSGGRSLDDSLLLLQAGRPLDLRTLQQLQPSTSLAQRTTAGAEGAAAAAEAQHTANGAASAATPAAGLGSLPNSSTTTTGDSSAASGLSPAAHIGTLWGLLVLSLAYLHHSTTGFALPALLPIISEDFKLNDNQGALLTAGYTILYAVSLVPMGLLADRVHRPRLLAGGIALWSLLTMAASETRSFGQLLATRVGFAAAQATQNPICFSLIPELFPKNRTTAMAVYNTAIYAGRALSFAAVIIAGQLGVPQGVLPDLGYGVGTTLVPMDQVDLSLVSVLYTQGEYAAVTPVFSYTMAAAKEAAVGLDDSAFSAWRQLLRWLAPPGLAVAALALLTVEEPRQKSKSGRFMPLVTVSGDSMDEGDAAAGGGSAEAAAAAAVAAAKAQQAQQAQQGKEPGSGVQSGAQPASLAAGLAAASGAAPAVAVVHLPPGTLVSAPDAAGPAGVTETLVKLRELVANPAFLALTLAAAMNDVGSWALVSWQATFYQRVYELEPGTYAPLLAVVIPVGGIIGGVGAGVFGDWLNRLGMRGWLTAGTCITAAPILAVSLLAPDYKQSFAALLVGFALSECWRAPAAVMVREVSPAGLGSTASAMHLCIRNLVGGLGPIAVAVLASKVGLQMAMLLVPTCYLASGLGLAVAEGVISWEKSKAKAIRHASEHASLQ